MQQDDRITVGIADQNLLIRAGVRRVLEHAEEIVVVGEAEDGGAAVELARRHRPQVLLMDTAMPGMDRLVAVRRVRCDVPVTKVIVLAAPGGGGLAVTALRAGAVGFLLKNGQPGELAAAVRGAAAGEVVLCPAITRRLVDQMISHDAEPRYKARQRIGLLTERELEVLMHVASGMPNTGIARAMWLSRSSIKAHLSRVFTKLDCDNRVAAALIAHDAGLIR